MIEIYRLTEEHVTFWTGVFQRLGLAEKGVLLESFLEDPCRFLRLIGEGEIESDLDLLLAMASRGTA